MSGCRSSLGKSDGEKEEKKIRPVSLRVLDAMVSTMRGKKKSSNGISYRKEERKKESLISCRTLRKGEEKIKKGSPGMKDDIKGWLISGRSEKIVERKVGWKPRSAQLQSQASA